MLGSTGQCWSCTLLCFAVQSSTGVVLCSTEFSVLCSTGVVVQSSTGVVLCIDK